MVQFSNSRTVSFRSYHYSSLQFKQLSETILLDTVNSIDLSDLGLLFSPAINARGGGRYMTCGWTGICFPIFRKVPTSNDQDLPSYPLLCRILAANYRSSTTKFCQTTHSCGRHIHVPSYVPRASTLYILPQPTYLIIVDPNDMIHSRKI